MTTVPNFQNDCRLLLEQDHLQHLQRVRILDLHPTQLAVGMQQVRCVHGMYVCCVQMNCVVQ